MLDAAVDDVCGFNTAVHRIHGVAHLGDHAAGDGAVGDEILDFARRQPRQELALLVEHTRNIGQENGFLGFEDAGDLARCHIRVDVVGVAIRVGAERGNHRDKIAGVQVLDDLRVNAGDFADLADVEHLVGFILRGHEHFLRVDEVAVLAGKTHRLAAEFVDEGNDVLVHQTAQHHFDHIKRFFIGHPHPLDEIRLLADLFQQVGNLRPAAVHHHGVHAHQLQQHHVLGEGFHQVALGHGIAAIFDDDGLVVETLDVRERFRQDVGLVGGGMGCGHGGSGTGFARILRQEKGGARSDLPRAAFSGFAGFTGC